MATYRRFVALGDSTTEGLDDPDGNGGWRGWADRLAERVDDTQPGLLYANLAVRGRLAREVRTQQLPHALALRPDLATCFAGLNDLLRPACHVPAVVTELSAMLTALRSTGATVVTLTLPDVGRLHPAGRLLRHRVTTFNDGVRQAAAGTGTIVADLGAAAVSTDPRLWSPDRLHANALGHARIAGALAEALGLPGADASWSLPLPAVPTRRRLETVQAEAVWVRAHLLPWVLRRLRRESSGDRVAAKRPHYQQVGLSSGAGSEAP